MNDKMPPKFSFDKYYALLREYAANPKTRAVLDLYDAEYAAGRGWLYTGGSEIATDAMSDFVAVGWEILVKHGWPTYSEAVKLQREDGLRYILSMGTSFSLAARRLIRKEPESEFPEKDFNLDDKDSVLEYLRMLMVLSGKFQIYKLPEEE